MQNIIVDNAKVMAKGQITLPKDVRDYLRLTTGDRITLICEGDKVVMMNSAVYAMKALQRDMHGEAEKAGIYDTQDVNAIVADIRKDIEGL